MRRRDERHARPWRPLASGLHNQTFAIDRHRHETAAVTLQNLARRRETRFFHPDRIAGRQQRARQQCQTGPMARRDEDLPRFTAAPRETDR